METEALRSVGLELQTSARSLCEVVSTRAFDFSQPCLKSFFLAEPFLLYNLHCSCESGQDPEWPFIYVTSLGVSCPIPGRNPFYGSNGGGYVSAGANTESIGILSYVVDKGVNRTQLGPIGQEMDTKDSQRGLGSPAWREIVKTVRGSLARACSHTTMDDG